MQAFRTLEDLVEELSFYGASRVADFGSGAGYLTLPIAKRVAQSGRVYAFDVQEAPLEALRTRARDLQLHNIETIRADLERERGSKLESASTDWVVIANILFQAIQKKMVLNEAYRILKNKGKILCIEWNTGPLGTPGPRPEMRIAPEKLKEFISALHCSVEREFVLGDHHYGLVAKKHEL